MAVAYVSGGLEAERAERDTIKQEEEDARERSRQAFNDMIEKAKAHAASPDYVPDPNARFRFKSEEAIEEIKMLEAGLKEWEIEEIMQKRRDER
jgi:hypothetical protein